MMKRKRPGPPAVARVSAPELTAERFRTEFAEAHAPCVLERCAHDWPALDAWTFSHLRRAVPEETLVEVACSRASRRETRRTSSRRSHAFSASAPASRRCSASVGALAAARHLALDERGARLELGEPSR